MNKNFSGMVYNREIISKRIKYWITHPQNFNYLWRKQDNMTICVQGNYQASSGTSSKELAQANHKGDTRDTSSIPWVRRSTGVEMAPTPIFQFSKESILNREARKWKFKLAEKKVKEFEKKRK